MKSFISIILIVFCLLSNVYALKPISGYARTPDSLGLNYEQLTIQTSDGFGLNSWLLFPSERDDSKPIIVFAYGDAGNMSYCLSLASFFLREGITVLLFDYRGFGKSESFPIDKNYQYYDEFALDAEAALGYAKKRFQKRRIGVYAFSMGTIMMAHAVEKVPVNFFMGEGLVYDQKQCVKRVLEQKQKQMKCPTNSRITSTVYDNLKIPMYLFAGSKDFITTVEDSKIVCRKNPKAKLEIFDGEHGQALAVLRYDYIRKLSFFALHQKDE